MSDYQKQQPSDIARDLFDPGWREREAESRKIIESIHERPKTWPSHILDWIRRNPGQW